MNYELICKKTLYKTFAQHFGKKIFFYKIQFIKIKIYFYLCFFEKHRKPKNSLLN